MPGGPGAGCSAFAASFVPWAGSPLRALGDLDGAREHYERALRILEAKLPAGHPHIQAARGDLAKVVQELGARKAPGSEPPRPGG